MGRLYSVPGQAVLGTNVTAVSVKGSATHRFGIHDIVLGCTTTPADQQMQWTVGHVTTAGTGTAVTPHPLHGDEIAAVATAARTFTAEPTYDGVTLLEIGLHQRSTFRWVARPGSEFICKAATAAGIAAKVAVTSGTPTAYATILFDE